MSKILDYNGNPIPVRGKLRADSGGPSSALPGNVPYLFPYDAANWTTQEMGDWLPWIRSPDSEINLFRDRMVGRSRDLVRNDGWASGGISRILDSTIGTNLRLSANPDYRALAVRSGKKAFDATWANEFRQAVEALWRGFSQNIGHYNDVSRQLTIGQQFRLALRHKLIDGESLGLMYWLPERIGYGAADYATALLLIDPDRLSNPYQMIDSKYMRGGVELSEHGVPIAYHIRKAEQNDWYLAVEANTWERVIAEDEDGWQRIIHDFDHDRAGQHRGVGAFTPVLSHAKMLARYYGVTLQAATIQAIFGTYVKSPYDPALVQDAIAGDPDAELPMYQELRSQWAKERPAMLNGARVPTLAPGEDIVSVSAEHPSGNFKDFAHEMVGIEAATLGMSKEQMTQDWSETNYSSARAAALETWKTLTRRNGDFKTNTATPVYAGWLQESFENGELPLPTGAPDFIEAKTAYSQCLWLGVPRGWVDETKEAAGAVMRMDAGLSTLKDEARIQGLDWEEVVHQRAIEVNLFKELGLKPPEWAGEVAAAEASRPQESPRAR